MNSNKRCTQISTRASIHTKTKNRTYIDGKTGTNSKIHTRSNFTSPILILLLTLSFWLGTLQAVSGSEALSPTWLELNQIDLWTTSYSDSRDYGVVLSGTLSQDTQFQLEYDSGWPHLERDSGKNQWRELFKTGHLGMSDVDKQAPAGPWLGSLNGPLGSAVVSTQWSQSPSPLFDYSRPVSGIHLSGSANQIGFSGFAGTLRQRPQVDSFTINSGKLHYGLREAGIIPGSEMVQITVYAAWDFDEIVDVFYPDYTMDYQRGTVTLTESPLARIGNNPARLVVGYEYQTHQGIGYPIAGGRLSLQQGPYSGELGYLTDSDPLGTKQVVSLAGEWVEAGHRVRLAGAIPLSEYRNNPDSTAWSAQVSTWLDDSLQISGEVFRYGIGFPDFDGSLYHPGEGGWAIDGRKYWEDTELALGYTLTTDDSHNEYPGRLQSDSRRVLLGHQLTEGVSVALGQTTTSTWAPQDPTYLGETTLDRWITLTNEGIWGQRFTYGWGHKTNTFVADTGYSRLNTRLLSGELFRELAPGQQLFVGVQREDSTLPGLGTLVNRRDSLLAGVTTAGAGYQLGLDGSIYQVQGEAWRQSQLGGSITASGQYQPWPQLNLLGAVTLDWFGQWHWQGDLEVAWLMQPNLNTKVNLSQTPSERLLQLQAVWYPAAEGSQYPLSLTQAAATLGRKWGPDGRSQRYGLEAEVELADLVDLAPSYQWEYGPGTLATTTWGVEVRRDLNQRMQLAAGYRRKSGQDGLGALLDQRVIGLKGRYTIAPGAAIALGHSWGLGFTSETEDNPTGWWLGIEM